MFTSLPPYSLVPVSFPQVIESISMPAGGDVSPLILALAPCRSGSTVLLRVLGASGIPAYFQPLKNTLRWAMQGQPWHWEFPSGTDTIFIKETLGPYTLLESTFNPFELLQALQYPMEKLRVLIVGRDPLYTWMSWYRNWGSKTNVELMIAAYRQIERIQQQVKSAGLPVVHFVYEAIRDFGPEKSIRGMFGQLDIPYSTLSISGWTGLPAYGEPGSNIYLDLEPEPFITPNIHDRVEKADDLHFWDGANPLDVCKSADVERIRAAGLDVLFAEWQNLSYSYLSR